MASKLLISDVSVAQGRIPRDRRFQTKVWARVRQPGRAGLTARVSNISRTGCLLECMAALDTDLPLTLKIENSVLLSGTIVWSRVGASGCQFDHRLDDQVLTQLVWPVQSRDIQK
ncbi:PilZ domain-containing protein [Altererythrobacter sp. GH1-8]|uniref:PilZ domain-containing protein n=1 Tax=Altererythrobacter sp. GH1-8 TaxID=3349333 RepID=UPI00374DF58F